MDEAKAAIIRAATIEARTSWTGNGKRAVWVLEKLLLALEEQLNIPSPSPPPTPPPPAG